MCNKIDVITLERLAEDQPESHALLKEIEAKNVPIMPISTLTKEGVMELRNTACERQLSVRVDQKLKNRKTENILNRVYVAEPRADGKARPPTIPPSVAENWKENKYISKLTDEDPNVVLESKIEEEEGDDYTVDYCKNKDLEDDEWKYDKIPRFWHGKNIADFIDNDIEKKFETLMTEEKDREAVGYYDIPDIGETEQDQDFRKLAKVIKDKIIINKINRRLDTGTGIRAVNRASRSRTRERTTTTMR